MKRLGKWIGRLLLGLLALIVMAALVSFVINWRTPKELNAADELDDLTLARIDEVFHLRRTLGESVWPGWGDAEIPVILYNGEYAFLFGYSGEPPAGWLPVGAQQPVGAAWERMPDAASAQGPTYRSRLPADGTTPQSFTVRIGDQWVATLGQLEWMKISMAQQIREDMPPVLREVFPYPLFIGLLLNGTDGHTAAVLHESFHAYEAMQAPDRLAAAEAAVRAGEAAYPWHDAEIEAAWQTELDLLADALRAESDEEARQLAQQFLAQRRQRRAGLAATLVEYEGHREWVEGLAKYVELGIWEAAHSTPDYSPVASLTNDADFDGYRNYTTRWDREVDQIRRMAGDEGDGRFYYSGMAQAVLLDRFAPGWQTEVLADDVSLDGLLAGAIMNENQK